MSWPSDGVRPRWALSRHTRTPFSGSRRRLHDSEAQRIAFAVFFTLIITAFDTIHFVPKFKAAAFVEYLLPHSRDELRWFTALSVTAGVCEELLYRGFLFWVLKAYVGVARAYSDSPSSERARSRVVRREGSVRVPHRCRHRGQSGIFFFDAEARRARRTQRTTSSHFRHSDSRIRRSLRLCAVCGSASKFLVLHGIPGKRGKLGTPLTPLCLGTRSLRNRWKRE